MVVTVLLNNEWGYRVNEEEYVNTQRRNRKEYVKLTWSVSGHLGGRTAEATCSLCFSQKGLNIEAFYLNISCRTQLRLPLPSLHCLAWLQLTIQFKS